MFNEFDTKTFPVLLIGFNRPELIAKRLGELSGSTSREIYVSIDYHSPEMQRQMEAAINNSVNSNSSNKVITIFHDKNLGLARHVTKAISLVLQNHDRVIVLEDDISVNEQAIGSLCQVLGIFEIGRASCRERVSSPV